MTPALCLAIPAYGRLLGVVENAYYCCPSWAALLMY